MSALIRCDGDKGNTVKSDKKRTYSGLAKCDVGLQFTAAKEVITNQVYFLAIPSQGMSHSSFPYLTPGRVRRLGHKRICMTKV